MLTNIQINDWVYKNSLVGKVVKKEENSEQIFVLWSNNSLPINEVRTSLRKTNYQGEDLAGACFDNGKVNRLVYEYGVKALVSLNGKRKPEVWSLSKLTNKLNGEKFNFGNVRFNEPIKLSLSKIRRDGGTQPRAAIDENTVNEYTEDMTGGAVFPPIMVFYDGEFYWLADGFHRVDAARKAGLTKITAIVKQGTIRDAVLYSVGANASHGLRRSNADKRRAVTRLLEDEQWNKWSNREIARQVGVSEFMVRKLRQSICDKNADTKLNNLDKSICDKNADTNKRKVIRGGKTYFQDTANIGKSKQTDSLPPTEDNEVINTDNQENVDDVMVETSDSETDVESLNDKAVETCDNQVNNNLKDLSSSSRNKNKGKLVNPLSVGDKVTVKKDHYFGGQNGVVTQTSSSSTVIVALDNGERNLFNLTDLDLSASRSKPIVMNSKGVKKPVKKEIHLTEGCNYKAGFGCRWYVEMPEFAYEGLKVYQKREQLPTLGSIIIRFLEAEGVLMKDPTGLFEYLICNQDELSLTTNNDSQQEVYPEDAIKFLDDD